MRLLTAIGAWIAGLALASWWQTPAWLLAAALVLAIATLMRLRTIRPLFLTAVCLCGLAAGDLRGSVGVDRQPDTVSSLVGQPVQLIGTVESPSSGSARTLYFSLNVEGAQRPSQRVAAHGRVGVLARQPAVQLRPGTRVEVRGTLEPSSPAGLGQETKTTLLYPQIRVLSAPTRHALERAVERVRMRLSASLRRVLPEPQNGVAQALVLGVRGESTPAVAAAFRTSGAAHLLSVSGLHVSAVLGAFMLLTKLWKLRPRLLRLLLPIGAIWAYAVLVGLPPPAARAATMGSIYLVATFLGRQRSGLDALLIAAFAITLLDPEALGQISFQLSFLAMLGIVVTMPSMQRGLEDPEGQKRHWTARLLTWLVVSTVLSAVASLLTMPLIALQFGVISLASIPTTLLALPALLPSLLAAFLAAVVGLLSPAAAWAFAWVAWLTLGYMTWVVQFFASLPASSLHVTAALRLLLFAVYALCFSLWLSRHRLAPLLRHALAWAERRLKPLQQVAIPATTLAYVVLAGAATATWAAALHPQSALEVVFLDVEHGDAILIKTPSGQTALVDGGPDGRLLADELGRYLGLRRTIDLVILTHPHEDHVGGLTAALQRYHVQAVLTPRGSSQSSAYERFEQALTQSKTTPLAAQAGQTAHLGETTFTVLSPPSAPFRETGADEDNNGTVVRLVYRGISFLLTGDIHTFTEDYLRATNQTLRSTVLKVAHHGSDTSTSPAFLKAVQPAVAVLSVAQDDPHGHPDENVTALLDQQVGQRVYSTAYFGALQFRTDGKRLWLAAERPPTGVGLVY